MRYNEAETRAKLTAPVLHAQEWIELGGDSQHRDHGETTVLSQRGRSIRC
jgi:hypothetical protein